MYKILRVKKKKEILVLFCMIAGIAIVTCCCYSNTWKSAFIFDDYPNIINNQFVKIDSLSWNEIFEVFCASFSCTNRKLSYLSFAVNYYIDRQDSLWYHVVNISIHIINTILLYAFLLKTLQSNWLADRFKEHARWLAWFAAMVWALHPIQTNAVTYIVQRMTSLAVLFALLSLVLWMKGRSLWIAGHHRRAWAGWVLATLSWGLGLLCKEHIAVLPFLILVHEYLLLQRSTATFQWRWILLGFLLFGLLGFLYLGIEPIACLQATYAQRDFTLYERLLTESRVLWHYLSLYFWPEASRFRLLYDYEISRGLFRPVTTFVSIVGWTGCLGAAFVYRKRYPIFLWAVAWYFVSHSIESSIIPLEIIYEHRMYLPSVGIAFAAVIVGYDVFERLQIRKGLFWTACSAVVIMLGTSTFVRNMDYRNAITFYTSELAKAPGSKRIKLNLAITLIKSGAREDGGALLSELVKEHPEDVQVLQNWHNYVVYELKDEALAEEVYQQIEGLLLAGRFGLRKDGMALWNLATYYYEGGHYTRTLFLIDRMLPDFDYGKVWMLRGRCLAAEGRWDEAATDLGRAAGKGPDDAGAAVRYAEAIMTSGKTAEGCRLLGGIGAADLTQETRVHIHELRREYCQAE